MIRASRRGRVTKWHKASTWQANDAFWITACGMAVYNVSAYVGAGEPMCERCRNSLHTDRSTDA
jgi:hypothetical protein